MIRRAWLVPMLLSVIAADLCVPTPAAAEDRDANNEFLIGADWPAMDGNSAAAAKEIFYQCGLNYARITGGGYNWAVKPHCQAAQELQAHGVKIILQLGSHYPSADYFKFTGDYLVDEANNTGKEDRTAWAITYNGQAWPQYSYAAGGDFRKLMEKDFRSYLENFKPFNNVRGVILHNEPGYFWLKERLFDYNPKAIAQFRSWLKGRHGSIDQLNARWMTRYGSFDEVQPPASKPPLEANQVAAWMDWRRFHVELIGQWMDWEALLAGQTWNSLPRTTNLSGPLENWMPYRCSDNDRFSKSMDLCGIDIYPSQWTRRSFAQYTMDMTHGVAAGRPIHVLECESFGAGVWSKYSEADRARLLRAELWSFIGHGANGILLWRLTGDSQYWLTRGEMNDRCKVMRDVAAAAKAIDLGTFQKPARRAALCVDTDPLFYLGAIEKKPLADTSAYCNDAQGLYCAMSDAGYETDVILARQVRQGAWKKYKVLVLANLELMDDELAKALRAFVQGGGVLVAAGPLATRDSWGKPLDKTPGYGLDSLVGDPNQTACHVIAAHTGQAYLEGWGGNAARKLMQDLLGKALGPAEVEVRTDGNSPVDASILQDTSGREILVLAQPLDQDKLPVKLSNVQVHLRWPQKNVPVATAYLPWNGEETSLAKPVKLEVRQAANGNVEFVLPEVDGAAAVLLAPPPMLQRTGGQGCEQPLATVSVLGRREDYFRLRRSKARAPRASRLIVAGSGVAAKGCVPETSTARSL